MNSVATLRTLVCKLLFVCLPSFANLSAKGAVWSLTDPPKNPGLTFQLPALPGASEDQKIREREAAEHKALKAYYSDAKEWVKLLVKATAEAKQIELICISPEQATDDRQQPSHATDSKHISGYPILAKAVITAPSEIGLVARELQISVEQRPKEMADCFEPRHALRITIGNHDYYALMCFTCSAANFFISGGEPGTTAEIPIRKESKEGFDRLFAAHSLKVAP